MALPAPVLKNDDKKPSLSFTMVYLTFFACLLWLLVSIVNVPYIRSFDVTAATGFLSPLLFLYFGRRWTDSKVTISENNAKLPATTDSP